MNDYKIADKVKHIISGIPMVVYDIYDGNLGLKLYGCRWIDSTFRVQECGFYRFELKDYEK